MSVEVYVDGSSRGQGVTPGVDGMAAVGVVIYRNNKLVGKYAHGIGRATNNVAEMTAILTGLLLCWANPELKDPIVYSDSQVACKMINGDWFCRNETLRPILMSIQEIQEIFRFRLIHVPRVEVAEADYLARKFQDKLQLKLAEDDELRKKHRRTKKKFPRKK